MSVIDNLKTHVPPYFPIVRKGCEDVSKGFFDCFTEHIVPGSTESGVEALKKCTKEVDEYKACFEKSMKDGSPAPIVLIDYDQSEEKH